MKTLYYCIWGVWTVIVLIAILFNHYAELHLEPCDFEHLLNQTPKQWAITNAVITFIWVVLTWIGLNLIYKGDEPSNQK